MFKRETEDYIIKYLDGYLTSKGFKHKKSQKTQIEYYRKFDNNNFEKFSLSTINYYDSHRLRFGFGKRIGAVEEIMTKINEAIPFSNPPYKKDSNTLDFGYNSYYGINQDGLPDYMETEQDVNNNVQKVIDFKEPITPFLWLTAFATLYEFFGTIIFKIGIDYWSQLYSLLEFIALYCFFLKLLQPKYKNVVQVFLFLLVVAYFFSLG